MTSHEALDRLDPETVRPPSSRMSGLFASVAPAATDTCIPVAMVSRPEARALSLDARALFVFGFINDQMSVYDVLTTTGLPLPDAAEALAKLCEVGAVALVSPR